MELFFLCTALSLHVLDHCMKLYWKRKTQRTAGPTDHRVTPIYPPKLRFGGIINHKESSMDRIRVNCSYRCLQHRIRFYQWSQMVQTSTLLISSPYFDWEFVQRGRRSVCILAHNRAENRTEGLLLHLINTGIDKRWQYSSVWNCL